MEKIKLSLESESHRFCVAPMMDWTDRHCRMFHRQLSVRARLYTEMIHAKALVYGVFERILAFNASEKPVALQLGGADPKELCTAARKGAAAGYDEINLNCGCPSERVQQGEFGACLMTKPVHVAQCVKALRETVSIPISVKHRIGLNDKDDYSFVRDFVGTVSSAGCNIFVVHARNAWLKGLSPKKNREIPPLRYEVVQRLKEDFPQLTIVINGGLKEHSNAICLIKDLESQEQFSNQNSSFSPTCLENIKKNVASIPEKTDLSLSSPENLDFSSTASKISSNKLDGVMFGRSAYQNPWILESVDSLYFGEKKNIRRTRTEIALSMVPYIKEQMSLGVSSRTLVRSLIGLFNGVPGASHWRFSLSDNKALAHAGMHVIEAALEKVSAA